MERIEATKKLEFGKLEVESVDKTDMRDIVADRVKLLRKRYRTIPLQLSRFNIKLADEIKKQWVEENKKFRQNNKREKPLDRLTRWQTMVKRYRLLALNELSSNLYSRFWKLRSDTVLIAAMYEFSEIENISMVKAKVKPDILSTLRPIVLRMKGPRKPTKKKILMKDIQYNVGDAYLEMVSELGQFVSDLKITIDRLIAPRKKTKLKSKLKRYQDVIVTREYLTMVCQAVAPRHDSRIQKSK